jgi:carbamate kinase
VTQVVVDKNDPAFQRPTKPIGPFYSKETAERKRKELGWNIIEDAARGYRRVVASPLPKDIVEFEVIKGCLERGIVVIAAGGGGIPVILEDGEVKGIEIRHRTFYHFHRSTGSVYQLQEIEPAKITQHYHGGSAKIFCRWTI